MYIPPNKHDLELQKDVSAEHLRSCDQSPDISAVQAKILPQIEYTIMQHHLPTGKAYHIMYTL